MATSPCYVIGTGRSGTRLFHELFEREHRFTSFHERHPMVEAFERYVEWNELPVDHGAFLAAQQEDIVRARDAHSRFVEASAYLSLSVRRLFDAFGARFLLVTRDPVPVVRSLIQKGWYADPRVQTSRELALGYHELGQPHHGFSRIAPRGEAAIRWSERTQVGRIAWYWRIIHERILEAFRTIASDHHKTIRIEDLDYGRYREIVGFFGEETSLGEAEFQQLANDRPNQLPASQRVWTATEWQELREEVGEVATALGYAPRSASPVSLAGADSQQVVVRRFEATIPPRSILVTIGPRNWDPDSIAWILARGIRHFRVNLARHLFERNAEIIEHIATQGAGVRPVIMVDLPGAKMRLGRFIGSPTLAVHAGEHLRLVHADDQPAAGQLPISTPEFFERVHANSLVTFSSSPIVLQLDATRDGGADARVLVGGTVGKFSGVWLDGPYEPYERLWANDVRLLRAIRSLPVDFVTVSFADSGAVIEEARALVGDRMAVAAKLESPAALASWRELLLTADAVMIGRDDLSRHLPLAHIQRWLRTAHLEALARSKPLIAASHYLARLSATGETDVDELDEAREVLNAGMTLCLADAGASDHWRALIETACTLRVASSS